jgi:hypothetical protein
MTENRDPHNPQDVKENQADLERKELQRREDLKWILSTQQGRRFIWRLLGDCGVFRISMTGSSYTFFNEGKRSIGNALYADVLGADDEAYLKMRKEAQGEKK